MSRIVYNKRVRTEGCYPSDGLYTTAYKEAIMSDQSTVAQNPVKSRQRKLDTSVAGKRFGRLLVTVREKGKWLCLCDCGGTTLQHSSPLLRGIAKSCGCLKRENNARVCGKVVHGLSHTKIESAWSSAKKRCYSPTDPRFSLYGVIGIYMCERWRNSLAAFAEDVGLPPTKDHSIDRINNDGNYEPKNCRWATPSEQSRNRRKKAIT